MGNCIAETEDVGMMKKGSDMHAVSSNVDTLDDSVLAALSQEAGLKQKLILKLSC